jgi:hypothetical protein
MIRNVDFYQSSNHGFWSDGSDRSVNRVSDDSRINIQRVGALNKCFKTLKNWELLYQYVEDIIWISIFFYDHE